LIHAALERSGYRPFWASEDGADREAVGASAPRLEEPVSKGNGNGARVTRGELTTPSDAGMEV